MVVAPPSDLFLAKPYLNFGSDRASDQSVTVRWLAPQAEGWSIKATPGKVGTPVGRPVRMRGVPVHHVFSASLNELPAGQRVRYDVIYKGNTVFSSHFTAPPSPTQRFRLAVVGDTGENSNGQRKVAYQMWRAKPDAAVVVGDIVYPHGRASEYLERWFPIANSDRIDPRAGAPLLRSMPWVGVAGNHDTAYRSLDRYPDGLAYYAYWDQPQNGPKVATAMRGDATALKAAAGPGISQGNFAFRYGNAQIVVLDANYYLGWPNRAINTWLDQTLAEPGYDWRFVFWHQPGYHSSLKKEDEIYMRSVGEILSRRNVDLVFNGHVHNYQRTHPISTANGQLSIQKDWNRKGAAKGTIYIVTGAGGAPLYDQRLASQPERWKPFTAIYKSGFSFSSLDVNGRRAFFRQIDGDGKEIDRFTLEK